MLILASGSPRRAEILKMLGFEFVTETADCDENTGDMPADKRVALLSRRKAEAVARLHKNDVVLGSDTLVTVYGAVLGKPHDEEEAFHMLKTLSGRGHEVMTGLNVWHEGKLRQEVVRTRVHFRPMTDAEIRAYIATGEPMDKAGSYGIQGYGAIFVDHLEGDYFSVMGLPLCALARMLAECGVSILREKEAPEG